MWGLSVEEVQDGQMPQLNEVEAGAWTEATECSEGYLAEYSSCYWAEAVFLTFK
jgi:hypothetical protein